MGRLQAEEMSRLCDEDTALTWHLRANHYPPVSMRFLPVAKAALQAYREMDYDRRIPLPEGVMYHGDRTYILANEVVEDLHLDSFLPEEDF